MPLDRMRFTIRRTMVVVAVIAVACKVFSELAGIETPSWWFVSLLVVMFGYYVVTAFACGFVLDVIAPLISRVNRPCNDSVGPSCRETNLYEPCDSMIIRSRRDRLDRDASWISDLADLSKAHRFSRSLLEEATARLAALKKDGLGQADSAMEDITPSAETTYVHENGEV